MPVCVIFIFFLSPFWYKEGGQRAHICESRYPGVEGEGEEEEEKKNGNPPKKKKELLPAVAVDI